MALNPIVFTEKVVRSFLRYQLTAYPFADHGLGHDQRAKHPKPLACRLGPRFYDWQLAQSAEESWRECHLHARNLLGEAGYRQLLTGIEIPKEGQKAPQVSEPPATYSRHKGEQGKLF